MLAVVSHGACHKLCSLDTNTISGISSYDSSSVLGSPRSASSLLESRRFSSSLCISQVLGITLYIFVSLHIARQADVSESGSEDLPLDHKTQMNLGHSGSGVSQESGAAGLPSTIECHFCVSKHIEGLVSF